MKLNTMKIYSIFMIDSGGIFEYARNPPFIFFALMIIVLRV